MKKVRVGSEVVVEVGGQRVKVFHYCVNEMCEG